MEHIIHSTVMKHLDMHYMLIDDQHDFQKSRSCESQLIMAVQDLADSLNGNNKKLKLELVFTVGVALVENDLICCLVLLPCLGLRLIRVFFLFH
jgi:hypothetical protein